MEYTVDKASIVDCLELAPKMRQSDIQEIWSSGRYTPTSGLVESLEVSGEHSYVLRLDGSSASTDAIADFYTDANHDVLRTGSGNITVDGAAEYGPVIKITGLNNGTYNADETLNLQQLPRVGQRFTSSAITGDLVNNTGEIYKVVKAVSTADGKADVTITPSVSKDAKWDSSTVLTFEDRKVVYVVETGEEIKEAAVAGVLASGTIFSKQKGNLQPVIFAGIPYDFKYQFSHQLETLHLNLLLN